MARKSKKQEDMDRKEAKSGGGLYRYPGFASEFYDWKELRIEDAYIYVNPKGSHKDMPARKMKETVGHKCPRVEQGCDGVLTWSQGGPFLWNAYWLWCPGCKAAWLMPHKYIWPIVEQLLKDMGIEANDSEAETSDSDEAEVAEDKE